MKQKAFFKIQSFTLLLSFLLVFVCVSSFSFWFYEMGSSDQYIETLSFVVASKKIVIDPGHGGIFPGKVGSNDLKEKDINLAIAKKLAGLLDESGAMVIMTRNMDADLVDPNLTGSFLVKQRSDLKSRAKLAQDFQGDLFISVHCNSTPSERWAGAQTFYDPDNEESKLLGNFIQGQIIEQLKNTTRQALVRRDTFLFDNLKMPTVIIECGFLSNPKERDLLTQEEYQHRIAFAIYSGIVKYLSAE